MEVVVAMGEVDTEVVVVMAAVDMVVDTETATAMVMVLFSKSLHIRVKALSSHPYIGVVSVLR